jgi:cytidylate kinase
MTIKIGGAKYVPGTYAKKRIGAAELAEKYILEWENRRLKQAESGKEIHPTICFSRKIGVGALEIADILAEKINYRVIDREIIEHIANEAKLSEKTVAIFDERYPGKIKEFLSFAFGEKSIIGSDYTRHLFSAIVAAAGLTPTIFVGRGAHLVLPRDRVLAIRFICSRKYRVKRLSEILHVPEKEADITLDQIDGEQRDFFKRVYGLSDASPYEFDMVINCDYIREPERAADLAAQAFENKFGAEVRNSWKKSS